MPDESEFPIGGADSASLKGIAHEGTLPDTDDDPVPWDAPWVETFDRWSHSATETIFLLFSETPSVLGLQYGLSRLTLFAQKSDPPEPGAYLVGHAATTYAWKLPMPTDFDGSCDAIQAEEALRDLPMVIIGKKPRRMFYFPEGIGSDAAAPSEIPLDRIEAELDWPKLKEQLDLFEAECVNTLEMMPRIWETQEKWHPKKGAEAILHGYLLVALRMVFRSYATLSEVNTPIGRADLLLQPRNLDNAKRAVVELKVLRTYSHTGETTYGTSNWEEVLEEGIRQAVSYASRVGAAIKVLCSYDMRKDKSLAVVEAAEAACSTKGVELCNFPVHNHVSEVRRLNAAPAE